MTPLINRQTAAGVECKFADIPQPCLHFSVNVADVGFSSVKSGLCVLTGPRASDDEKCKTVVQLEDFKLEYFFFSRALKRRKD